MTDYFGDHYPFSYNDPLVGSVEASIQDPETMESVNAETTARLKEVARAILPWAVLIGGVVGTGVYVSQQHGLRPTLIPAETTIISE